MELNRIPVIALSYTEKETSINKELLIDYSNGDIYIKDETGNIKSCTSKYAEVSDRTVILDDGREMSLKNILDECVKLSNPIGLDISKIPIKYIETHYNKTGEAKYAFPVTSISAVMGTSGDYKNITLEDVLNSIKENIAKQSVMKVQVQKITATENNQRVFVLSIPTNSGYKFYMHSIMAFKGSLLLDTDDYIIDGDTFTISDACEGISLGRDLIVFYVYTYYPITPSELESHYDIQFFANNSIPINKLEKTSNSTNLQDPYSLATSLAVYEAMQKAIAAYDLALATPAHAHDNTTITSLDGAKIFGKIPIECIPDSAQKKLHTVADLTARNRLTAMSNNNPNGVSLYDYVKVLDIGDGVEKVYLVIDLDKLNTDAGYQEFSGGENVSWNSIVDKPNTLAGYGITDGVLYSLISSTPTSGKLLLVNANGKLPADISGDAATLGGKSASSFALTNHIHSLVTQAVNGFMSAGDKAKLDGIESGANNYSHPLSHSASMIEPTPDKMFITQDQLNELLAKPSKSEVLTKINTIEFTPTEDYHPATKKFVLDNNLSDIFTKSTTSSSNDTIKAEKIFNASKGIIMNNGTTLVHNNTTIIDGSGIVYNAAYNDLAEAFESNEADKLEPGDVVICDENGNYIKSTLFNDRRVVGVVSDTYGQLLGASGDIDLEKENLVPIGLAGRVYTKVYGKANVGDLLVSSDIPGVAIVNNDPKIGTIIGKVVEKKTTNEISRVRMLIINS